MFFGHENLIEYYKCFMFVVKNSYLYGENTYFHNLYTSARPTVNASILWGRYQTGTKCRALIGPNLPLPCSYWLVRVTAAPSLAELLRTVL